MKSKPYKWRLFYVSVIALYIISIIVALIIMNSVPKVYSTIQKNENKKLNNAVLNTIKGKKFNKLQDLVDKHLVDITLYNQSENKVVYSSLNYNQTFSSLELNANEKIISSREVFKLKIDQENYEVLIIQYYPSPQTTFDFWIKTLGFLLGLLLTIIVVALIILFHKFVKPLNSLKQTIQAVSTYQLNMIKNESNSSEYGKLNEELLVFSKKLQSLISKTGHNYNKLEQSLIVQNENILYKNKMIVALTHDLKAPLSIIKLKLELLKNKQIESDINELQTKVDNLILEINDVNKIAYANNNNLILAKENIKLIDVLTSSLNNYEELFAAKDLYVELEYDEDIYIYINKVKLKRIFENIFSNICNHASPNSDVEIKLTKDIKVINMSFYNECLPLDKKALANFFELYYINTNKSSSSGMGMYITKSIITELQGKVNVTNYRNGIVIDVELPYE